MMLKIMIDFLASGDERITLRYILLKAVAKVRPVWAKPLLEYAFDSLAVAQLVV